MCIRDRWVSSASRLYQLCQLSVAQQVSSLVLSKKVPEALDLLQRDQSLSELQKNEEQLRVHTEAGFVYFQDLEFQRAMRHFKQAQLTHSDVINLDPKESI
eukprot:TRINITY_DN46693_c0_g1_i1.p1 TRINITY_DN46693_c0_g1~~TRINITY_DN46693_c0_g1_i1.p1  ORF type:complete len:101 (+),score=30.38 TRINITY_DN46693_c0_g1_i1:48-350(+)